MISFVRCCVCDGDVDVVMSDVDVIIVVGADVDAVDVVDAVAESLFPPFRLTFVFCCDVISTCFRMIGYIDVDVDMDVTCDGNCKAGRFERSVRPGLLVIEKWNVSHYVYVLSYIMLHTCKGVTSHEIHHITPTRTCICDMI